MNKKPTPLPRTKEGKLILSAEQRAALEAVLPAVRDYLIRRAGIESKQRD